MSNMDPTKTKHTELLGGVVPFQNSVWQAHHPFKIAIITKKRNFMNYLLLLYFKSKLSTTEDQMSDYKLMCGSNVLVRAKIKIYHMVKSCLTNIWGFIIN